MAEKVPIVCPECAKQFQAPAEIVGRKIRCKNCGKAFVAKKAVQAKLDKLKVDDAIIALKKEEDEDGDGKPYEVTTLDTSPRCPSCANELDSEDDVVCLTCGFNLHTRTAVQTRRVKDVTGNDQFMWLLPGILAAVGFFLVLGTAISTILFRIGWDPDPPAEQWWKNIVNCFGLWTVIICIALMYSSGKFAIKRLIMDNKPPEIEL